MTATDIAAFARMRTALPTAAAISQVSRFASTNGDLLRIAMSGTATTTARDTSAKRSGSLYSSSDASRARPNALLRARLEKAVKAKLTEFQLNRRFICDWRNVREYRMTSAFWVCAGTSLLLAWSWWKLRKMKARKIELEGRIEDLLA